MDENLKLMVQYASLVLSEFNWQVDLAFGLGCALIGAMWYYNSPRHLERAVSKRKIQARHRKVVELAEDAITDAMEKAHLKGDLKRTEVDFIYNMLRTHTKLKTIGPEPSFGRPWYYGPQLPQLAKLKAKLIVKWGQVRLPSIHVKKKETAKPSSKHSLLASIKRAQA